MDFSTLSSVDELWILQKKAQEIAPLLNGRSVYLVGMMGSGKTTVGKILSEVLQGYSFTDSDKLVEQAMGASVSQIFKEYGETFFRDNETQVLRDLSFARCQYPHLVVATGGGSVIRSINWKYMKQGGRGIIVWLNVPLEALAKRIAAVGTESRPLLMKLQGTTGNDAYTKALSRLSLLCDERGGDHVYFNADVEVSVECIASKLGHGNVSIVAPTAIAIEVLIQIEKFLKGDIAILLEIQ